MSCIDCSRRDEIGFERDVDMDAFYLIFLRMTEFAQDLVGLVTGRSTKMLCMLLSTRQIFRLINSSTLSGVEMMLYFTF